MLTRTSAFPQTEMHTLVEAILAGTGQSPRSLERSVSRSLDDIVRRGRKKGIGVTLITQRPAVIDKDVLSQVSMLIVHRLTAPQDQDQIWEWVKRNGNTKLGKQMMANLPKMKTGRCWVYSPGWLELFGEYAINKKTTFDSSATPTPGKRRIKPKRMAKVELEAVRESLASTIKASEDANPVLLHQKIRKLEAEKRAMEIKLDWAEKNPAEVEVEQVYSLSDEQSDNVLENLREIGKGLVRDAQNTAEGIENRIMDIVHPGSVSRRVAKIHKMPAPKRAATPPEGVPLASICPKPRKLPTSHPIPCALRSMARTYPAWRSIINSWNAARAWHHSRGT